ncbi:hypothetical protein Q73_14850 [Bacillus coahuilensis m2-6]|uniref:NYN domain-containing protein n=1 Tax=Bacillus coahuilensis p1.1.43 TaxID=1150625 RepID=A0A147K5C4_9BACI|nr:NYN domain-containing protein [Bacillus coahuilensis]KUP04606.1 hypothetical protein Q73_14850 [Bacillus coahuilensis m2-6]KUP04806.1 hypothetical protein Q75_14365 [Bacillus coahuilensis p1.1.43]
MEQILLVDGYNMIGAWPELKRYKNNDLSQARDILVEWLADYQGYTGFKVIVVFDAHFVQGIGKKYRNYNVDVLYTREKETADERIEKLAIELTNIRTEVHVATSDFTEQWVIFAQGALRKSARELHTEIKLIQNRISRRAKKISDEKPLSKIDIPTEVAEIFEKWRRGDS